jgi:transcriptional regulator with XRE-family HTH domain
MSTIHTPIVPTHEQENLYVIRTSPDALNHVSVVWTPDEATADREIKTPQQALRERPEWADPEYRRGYMDASIEEGLAWQIRANREQRKLTQGELGAIIGTTQSGIHRFEDPEYGKHSIETLVKLAHAFDCALSVKFVPYSQLALESEDLSPEALHAESYEVEARQAGVASR